MKRGGEVEMGIEAIGTYKLSFVWGNEFASESHTIEAPPGSWEYQGDQFASHDLCSMHVSRERAPDEMPWKLSHQLAK